MNRRAPTVSVPVTAEPKKSKDPLHGVTLEQILTELVAAYGWAELGRRIRIRCFNFEPSISSSLKFLRRTPWARQEVEDLYRKLRLGHPPSGQC